MENRCATKYHSMTRRLTSSHRKYTNRGHVAIYIDDQLTQQYTITKNHPQHMFSATINNNIYLVYVNTSSGCALLLLSESSMGSET